MYDCYIITPLSCSSGTHNYVCKKWKPGHEPTAPPPTSVPTGHCGDDKSKRLIEFNGYCYKFIGLESHNVGLTWDEANLACKELANGYQLASIHSERESAFIYTMYSDLLPENYGTWFWFGANDKDDYAEGTWTYIDNTPFDYTHWKDNEPNNQVSHFAKTIIINLTKYVTLNIMGHLVYAIGFFIYFCCF